MSYLCISDYEGTLIKNDNTISDYTTSIINKFIIDNNFIIVSESSFNELIDFKNKYNLNIDLISTNDGILLINNKIIKYEIDLNILSNLFNIFKSDIYTAYNDKYIYNYQDRLKIMYPKDYIITDKFISSTYINIAINILKNDEFISFLKENELSYKLIGKDKNRAFYNIKKIDINKDNAFNVIKEYYKNKKTIGFADSYSDFKLLSNLDIKIAMKNSDNLLKEKCDYITNYSNDEDGLAKFLDNICHF